MASIAAFATRRSDRAGLDAAACAVARSLNLTVELHALPDDMDRAAAAVLRALERPAARLAALSCSDGHAARLATQVIQRCPKPILLVPTGHRARAPAAISRLLVPLDGTAVSATAVAETVRLFAASGLDIIVLHVFDETTVPKFWDQPAHARKSWEEEFLARYCNQPTARFELRSGRPGELVVDVAASEQVDLIALGWAQNLSPGRADTVRTTISRATTPILLLPVGAGPDG